MQSKRSLAAKKANETRGPEGRHEAALKAWRTRRKNELNAKRREAALKAWKVRKRLYAN